jgi:hypothetical protein
MPLTTRFLFEVVLEAKIDPCVIDKFRLRITKTRTLSRAQRGAAPRVKIKSKSKAKALIADLRVTQ